MINKFRRVVFFLCLIPSLISAKSPSFEISGIKGDVLTNVQHRLNELYKNHVIANDQLEEFRLQIERAMYPYGYFKPHITMSTLEHHTTLFIRIDPGPEMPIAALTVQVHGEGAQNIAIQKVIHNLPIKVGQTFNQSQYDKAKEGLLSVSENQGYLHASFERASILIDKQRYQASIVLQLVTGPLYYFGQVRFSPASISPALLYRYVPFQEGLPYTSEQILTLNNNLSASGYFKSVDVKPILNKERYVPIDVNLKSVNRFSYSVGGGYGTDTGPRGRVGMQIVPINRSGHKLNIVGQGSLQQNAVQAQYIIPGGNPMTDKFSINGGLSNLSYSSGKSNALQLSLAHYHVLSNHQRILSLNGLNEHFYYVNQSKQQESLIYPKAVFSWNKKSDPMFTPTGYNVSINGLVANKALLSQINLAEAGIDAKVAYTFLPIRTRLYLHTIQSVTQINDINQLPLSLAQLLGGSENLKAFGYKSIGPGKILSYGGIEIQKETVAKWYAIGFFDNGVVYNPSIKIPKYDVGLGVMWVSLIGPIKVGVAQAIDHRWHRIEGTRPRLVVNMGPDI